MGEFLGETNYKAVRKPHQCIACCKTVDVGQPAIVWAGKVDGDFNSNYYHPECRAAEIALNELRDWRWSDDWVLLNEIESEDYKWIQQEHPDAWKRLGRKLKGNCDE